MSIARPEIDTKEVIPGIHIFPIVHASVEYTVLLREYLLTNPPGALAIELPENFTKSVEEVLPIVDDIPVITLSHEDHSREIHYIMEPLEPITEAIRSAHELQIPWHLIDLFNEDFLSWIPEAFPDTYSLRVMSPLEMYEKYEESRKNSEKKLTPVDIIDELREIHMAEQIRNLLRVTDNGDTSRVSLLIVCGIKHAAGITRYLQMTEEEFAYKKNIIGDFDTLEELDEEILDYDEEEPLEALLNRRDRIDMNPETGDSDVDYSISILSRETPQVLSQPGYFNTTWLLARRHMKAIQAFNRILIQRYAYRDAVQRYERESGELFAPQKEKLFFRFTRNWSLIEERLLPDLYRMVMAARGFGNDNFARIMYDILNFLRPAVSKEFDERKLTLDDMHRHSKLIHFRLKLQRKRPVPPPNIIKKFEREKYPGQWTENMSASGICSYPPEDIIIEDFGRYLQGRASSVMHGREEKVIPFTSSLMDGIDYRETIRNLHLGKIYVKDSHKRAIEAGSVVIIFNEDDTQFEWKAVWWGEHNQESDMAFYATAPGDQVVGPGIFRCTYGGLMLTYPPGRLHDIWQDEFYERFSSPSDKLLAAAIEFNEKRAVVHLADRSPSSRLIEMAGRFGQTIVHIPLSSVNPVTLGRVHRFHVLDSHDRRNDADDYIW